MKRNVSSIDSAIRVIIGALVIALGVYYNKWWGALGALPIISAALGWCPLYSLFKIGSCKGGSCCCKK